MMASQQPGGSRSVKREKKKNTKAQIGALMSEGINLRHGRWPRKHGAGYEKRRTFLRLINSSIGEKGKKGRDAGGKKKRLAMSTLNTGRETRKEEDGEAPVRRNSRHIMPLQV